MESCLNWARICINLCPGSAPLCSSERPVFVVRLAIPFLLVLASLSPHTLEPNAQVTTRSVLSYMISPQRNHILLISFLKTFVLKALCLEMLAVAWSLKVQSVLYSVDRSISYKHPSAEMKWHQTPFMSFLWTLKELAWILDVFSQFTPYLLH